MNPPKVEFLRTISKFRNREEISSSLVYFLCKTFSRGSRAVTAKKCTKKPDARVKIFVLVIKPIAFLTTSLPWPLPSSDLKVPILIYVG